MVDEFTTQFHIAFFSTLGLLLLLERSSAWRREAVGTGQRWTSNIGLLVAGSVVTGLLVPVGLVGFADAQPPGPMARLGWPMAVQIAVTFLALDLYRYWEHRLYHHVPLLWRLHLVHHSDTQIDVTTTERHHPLEFILGTALLLSMIYLFGLPAAGVAVYLLVATVVALYSHANLHPPMPIDRVMRRLIVTAPLHAIHHSDLKVQTNSNYASVLPLWDRMFGTYSDPERVKVARYGLEYFHEPKDAGLGRVMLQPFVYRENMAYPARAASAGAKVQPAAASATLDPHWHRVLLWALPGLALAAAAMWTTLAEMARLWTFNESYQYGWLVLPMVVYLFGWHRREDILAMTPRPGYAGVFAALAAATLWSVALVMNVDAGRHLAFVFVLQALAMAILGWRAYRQLFPMMALLFFIVPVGDVLQPVLRLATIKSVELFSFIAGLPYRAEGFVIHIGKLRYIVVEECTGLTYVLLAAFLCYSLGSLLYRSFWKLAALAAAGALLGVLSNTVRVNAIVLADWLQGTQMSLASHGAIQWATLLLTICLVLILFSRLAPERNEAVQLSLTPPRPTPRWYPAPLLAGLAVLIVTGTVHMRMSGESTMRSAGGALAAAPRIEGWEAAALPGAWKTDNATQTRTLTLVYHREGQVMRARIVEALSPAAKLSAPHMAPDGKEAWRESAIGDYLACASAPCTALLHSAWQHKHAKDQPLQHVFYSYGIGQTMTASGLRVRALSGWRRITGSPDTPYMLGLMFERGLPPEQDVAKAFDAIRSSMQAGALHAQSGAR
jgi:exosortase